MFGFGKKAPPSPALTPQQERLQRIRSTLNETIPALGELIEKYPGSMLDEKLLPMPKEDMKLALKMAIRIADSEAMKEHIATGYMLLSMFQPGIGPRQIQMIPPEDPFDKAAMAQFSKDTELFGKSSDEGSALLKEITEFRRVSDAKPRG
jgi:hypothetical protein